jgi:hypothetical protein
MSSNVSTPNLEPTTVQAPSVSSPLASGGKVVAPAKGLDDDIPPLSLDVLTVHNDKVEALRLVADSIAQQRQTASLALVFHPACLAVLVAALAGVYQWFWVQRQSDPGSTMMIVCGVIMTYLLAIRYAAGGYLRLAEAVQWSWLQADDGEEDLLIGTKFGGEMVGALVLRLEPSPGKKRGGSRGGNLKGGKGLIRAWTTKLRFRRKGVGSDMLHEAVRVTRDRCGKDAEIGFAQEHANSTMLLPDMFNRPFKKREMQAAKALEEVLAEWDGNKRKKR